MVFEFATASRIVFGRGASTRAGAAARDLGRHALLVTGATPSRTDRVREDLRANGIAVTQHAVRGEPDLDAVRAGAQAARESGCDVVVAVGGGSVLDAGKAFAALAANDGDVLDYLEVVGQGRPLLQPSLPCVAIPTTAGTGSEATRNAVVASAAGRVKASLRSASMLPRLALVDPDLTIELPPALTATTGLDALTQLIEAYLSRRANPITDALCIDGMQRAGRALPAAFAAGTNLEAREGMSLASLFGGVALANAGLGAVHGFAGAIGGMFDAPHGAICAALLPLVMAGNLQAIEAREPQHPARQRFDDVARLLTGRPAAGAREGVEWLARLVDRLQIQPLAAFGVAAAAADEIVERARRSSSMQGNPIELTESELRNVLGAALS